MNAISSVSRNRRTRFIANVGRVVQISVRNFMNIYTFNRCACKPTSLSNNLRHTNCGLICEDVGAKTAHIFVQSQNKVTFSA